MTGLFPWDMPEPSLPETKVTPIKGSDYTPEEYEEAMIWLFEGEENESIT